MQVLKTLPAFKTGTAITGLLLSAALIAQPAAAVGATPEAVVNTAVERTLSALEDNQISDQEADAILELIDVDRVAPFTMGRHWRTMDDATQASFVKAFRQFARVQLREHLAEFSDAEVEILRTVERKPGDAIVTTKVSADSEEHTVSWRVTENDGWKVTDIEAMGLWFAIEQRAQFQAMLDQNGGNVNELIKEIGSAR
ncbi:toluene tolerance protein, Ttg2 family [Hyphomonas neptunium ATCC 15444]|uniref:Toluene tolerance protein, Ttg2 family n=2 Tax=Hyphomonas TaxID=85 RepID=Q0C0A8_HYPNA|nr:MULTISPECIES: ABC transporter substrate-binding protein [Hyphomonas]ABI76030.1 toluene tolerance protein, Ttg2 family [Hyphomonas neptunium ATCC 15444]KCZ90584.1 Ttg2 family toluene tolerance protein [Hyphomonas hirschiana VP5]